MKHLARLTALFCAFLVWSAPTPALAQAYQYYDPPLSFSNAELTGKDFSGKMMRSAEFSNANLELTDFSDADLQGSVFSASVMTKSNLRGANLRFALVDQVSFTGADLRDAVFTEAILLRSTFEDAKIEGADFTDAILDGAQVKELCQRASGANPETGVATRESLGCR